MCKHVVIVCQVLLNIYIELILHRYLDGELINLFILSEFLLFDCFVHVNLQGHLVIQI